MSDTAARQTFWALGPLVALALAGCATSSTTRTPSLPQPPSIPSLPAPPAVPSPPTTSRAPDKPSTPGGGKEAAAKGEKGAEGEGESEGKAEKSGNADEAAAARTSGAEETGGGSEGGPATDGAAAGSAGKVGATGEKPGTGSTGSARTPDEERDALDGQLQTSMGEFDQAMLDQQKALEEKQRRDPLPERATAGGAGGGGGEGAAGAAGGDDRTPAERRADAEAEAQAREAKAGQEVEKAGQETTSDAATGGSQDAGRLEGGTPVTSPVEGAPETGKDDIVVPKDVGDGKDDDVVARQIREAAMKEKDPAIREKLWEEYREYKKSAGKGGS